MDIIKDSIDIPDIVSKGAMFPIPEILVFWKQIMDYGHTTNKNNKNNKNKQTKDSNDGQLKVEKLRG